MPYFSSFRDRAGHWSGIAGVAADEAGGHAFVTTFAQGGVGAVVYQAGTYDLVGLDPGVVLVLRRPGLLGHHRGARGVRRARPAPEGISEVQSYNCPTCYSDEWADLDLTFDAVAATADLDLYVVGPRSEAQDVLDAIPYITRLENQLSPSEMTVDPRFGSTSICPRCPAAT